MSQPYKIVTGEPVTTPEGKYGPQRRHMSGQARSFATFEEMCESLVCVGRAAVKTQLGYFVPGGLLEYAKRGTEYEHDDKAGRRCNGNIGELHFVAFDIDELHSLELDMLLESLEDSGVEAYVYHTPSSTSDSPRVRILVNLSAPQPSATEDKANLMIDIATEIWGEPTGEFQWQCVDFDKTAFREAQYMIRPHDGAEAEYFNGVPVDVSELEVYEHDWQLPGVYDTDYGQGEFDDAHLQDWREWAVGRGLRIEGDKIIVLCPNRAEHSSNSDGLNSTAIKMPREGHPEARFNCMHHSCDHLNRNQRDTMTACGVPDALLPDAHGSRQVAKSGFTFGRSTPVTNTPEQRAAALALMGVNPDNNAAPKRQRARAADSGINAGGKWDGMCGDYRDKLRDEVRACCKIAHLWQVPPDIEAKRNKDGDIIGYTPLNTADNLQWLLELQQWTLARNTMTWEFEAFDRDGKPLTRSANETDSLVMSECARRRFPDTLYDRHRNAIASRNHMHPVQRMLHGRKWDGVKRVDSVLECINAEDPAYASTIMRCLLVGGISAIDDGSVEMKFCPVLHSEANDWHKSQFVHRLFGLTERSYKGGLAIPDPTNKDSLASVLLTWGGEFGELGGMGKRDTEVLKAWIPQPSDEWRPPYARHSERKMRQNVYVGTVNRNDFISDPTIATRFPVIKLAGPVRIDEINEILGWEFDGNRAVLADAEKLVQFWLEVRQMKADGVSYILPKEVISKVGSVGDSFTNKGSFYEAMLDVLHSNPDENVNHDWMSATEVCRHMGFNLDKRVPVGKALKKLLDEGWLASRNRGGLQYWFPKTFN